jgi:hypothetical protein
MISAMTTHLAALLAAVSPDTVQAAHDASGSASNLAQIGGILGVLSLLITITLGMVQMGAFNRPRHLIVADYLRQGGESRFALHLENRGNTTVVFQSFELLQPRLKDVFDQSGDFILTDGAEVFEEGSRKGNLPSRQEFSRIDRDRRQVELQPHGARTEIFEIETSAAESPILVFRDGFGNRFHCDEKGVHAGRYQYPHRLAYLAALGVDAGDVGIFSSRSLFRRWRQGQSRLDTV